MRKTQVCYSVTYLSVFYWDRPLQRMQKLASAAFAFPINKVLIQKTQIVLLFIFAKPTSRA